MLNVFKLIVGKRQLPSVYHIPTIFKLREKRATAVNNPMLPLNDLADMCMNELVFVRMK